MSFLKQKNGVSVYLRKTFLERKNGWIRGKMLGFDDILDFQVVLVCA